jgi:hypothetical protein
LNKLALVLNDDVQDRGEFFSGINNMERIVNRQETTIATPEMCRLKPEESAVDMIKILGLNYGTHNLSSNIDALVNDIRNGRIQPFLQKDIARETTACAALVQISPDEVELGRGACVPKMQASGAAPLIVASEYWKMGLVFPESKILKAEVRCAKPTKEVPGGQATQAICLQKVGLVSTGFGPFFHHGVPDRQEHFLLASIVRNKALIDAWNREKHVLSASLFSNDGERKVFTSFWKKYFGSEVAIIPEFGSNGVGEMPFKSCCQGPLIALEPGLNSGGFPVFDENHRFMVAGVDMDLSLEAQSISFKTLKKQGFSLVGFEPKMGVGRLKISLLMGKLSEQGKNGLVLPSFIENIFSHETEDSLIDMAVKWRRSN